MSMNDHQCPFVCQLTPQRSILAPRSLLARDSWTVSVRGGVAGALARAAPGLTHYLLTTTHQAPIDSVPLGTVPPTHGAPWGTLNHRQLHDSGPQHLRTTNIISRKPWSFCWYACFGLSNTGRTRSLPLP